MDKFFKKRVFVASIMLYQFAATYISISFTLMDANIAQWGYWMRGLFLWLGVFYPFLTPFFCSSPVSQMTRKQTYREFKLSLIVLLCLYASCSFISWNICAVNFPIALRAVIAFFGISLYPMILVLIAAGGGDDDLIHQQ